MDVTVVDMALLVSSRQLRTGLASNTRVKRRPCGDTKLSATGFRSPSFFFTAGFMFYGMSVGIRTVVTVAGSRSSLSNRVNVHRLNTATQGDNMYRDCY